jgi:23S rRNA (uracil1939-C5)-methyltransferase
MTFKAEIVSMAFGGKGVARVDGKVWFVQGGIPEDVVEVLPTESNERFGQGRIASFHQKSRLRSVVPPCSVSNICGGCQWQDVSSEVQLQWKMGFVRDAMERVGKISVSDISIQPSPEHWAYRSRVTIRVHIDGDGKVDLGFFKGETRELVSIKRCEIASRSLNSLLEFLLNLSLKDNRNQSFRLELQEVPAHDGANVWATIFPTEGRKQKFSDLINKLSHCPQVLWCGLVFDLEKSQVSHFESDQGIDFYASPGQFQQVNLPHNRNLRRLVSELVEKFKPKRLLDVFCGSGNLSFPLARRLEYLEGVELNPRAIRGAQVTAEKNGLLNTKWVSLDAAKHLQILNRENARFDVVLLDPPREGFQKGLAELIKLSPKAILYVSCDPMTLARDLAYLSRQRYRVEKIICFDFFPNTFHVESLAVLTREDVFF